METKSHPKDITEAMETVHSMLRVFFFTRIKGSSAGGYELQNRLLGSTLFAITLIAADSYFVIGRYSGNNTVLFGIIEILSSADLMIGFVITLCTANSENGKEFDILSNIDELFGVKNSGTYRRDQRNINISYFIILSLRVSTLILCIIFSNFMYHVKHSVPFYTRCIMQFLTDVSFIYNISKLQLVKYRIVEMKKQICMGNISWSQSETEIEPQKMRLCYLKIYESCLLFNFTRGPQILFAYSNCVLWTATVIHLLNEEFPKLENWAYLFFKISCFSFLVMDLVMMVALLMQTTSILQTSRDISLVVERALVMKYFGTERESAAWEEFVELVHRCPLVLTAYDFFTLDYSLLGATFGTMVTYTIILTQIA